MDRSPQVGGWGPCIAKFLRNCPIWRVVRDYFPAQLIKTCDLKPDRPYVFGYHPHGIISVGALLNFGTNATGFDDKFPGVRLHVLGAGAMFKVPFFREWLLAHGGGSVDRHTCEQLLKKGESIMILPGGARESLEAHPDTIVLTLSQRKGFVRVALASGAGLVPVLSFGENELFAQVPNPKGSTLRRIQEHLLQMLGFTLPSFFGIGSFPLAIPTAGLGFLQYGLLPYQRPLTVIVGPPLELPHVPNPSAEVVDEWHDKYMTALTTLYQSYKGEVPLTPKNNGAVVEPSFVIK